MHQGEVIRFGASTISMAVRDVQKTSPERSAAQPPSHMQEHKIMTKHSLAALIAAACGSLFAGAALAQSAADPYGPAAGRRDGPRVMMYLAMPFEAGALRRTSYGFRLDSAPLPSAAFGRVALFDLRWQPQRRTLLLNGMPAARWSDGSIGPSDSSGGPLDSLVDPSSPWFYLGLGAGALAASCLTHNWPCRRNDSNGGTGYTPPPTTTTGPG